MLGKRSAQYGLFAADHLYLAYVGRDTFSGVLAAQRGRLFREEDCAALDCPDKGRSSVPPSRLATARLFQTNDGVSDEAATARADFDRRGKVALGIGIDERPFAKRPRQLFRAQLILHDHVRAVFQKSRTFAREAGDFQRRKIKAVLDTSSILGRGAVKDPSNLLADGMVQLIRALARRAGSKPAAWAARHDRARSFGASLTGEVAIDGDDPHARQTLRRASVAEADRLLAAARAVLADRSPEDPEHARLREAADLLGQLLVQDIERRPAGAVLKEGGSPDRLVAVPAPEMRPGRKSAAKRFDGHTAAMAGDPASQRLTAAVVLPGNAQDHEQALELVKQTDVNADVVVAETVGDCADGDRETRQACAEAKRKRVAKVPNRRTPAQFSQEDFAIDLQTRTCVCPAGQVCRTVVSIGSGKRYGAPGAPVRAFRFAAAVCDAGPLRSSCVRARPGRGRLVMLHPQEALLQAARAFQQSRDFVPDRTPRQVAAHRLTRPIQLGVRPARYFGRAKTGVQLLLAATVANLTLVATKVGLMRDRSHRKAQLVAPLLASVVLLLATCRQFVVQQLGPRPWTVAQS